MPRWLQAPAGSSKYPDVLVSPRTSLLGSIVPKGPACDIQHNNRKVSSGDVGCGGFRYMLGSPLARRRMPSATALPLHTVVISLSARHVESAKPSHVTPPCWYNCPAPDRATDT